MFVVLVVVEVYTAVLLARSWLILELFWPREAHLHRRYCLVIHTNVLVIWFFQYLFLYLYSLVTLILVGMCDIVYTVALIPLWLICSIFYSNLPPHLTDTHILDWQRRQVVWCWGRLSLGYWTLPSLELPYPSCYWVSPLWREKSVWLEISITLLHHTLLQPTPNTIYILLSC